jgi:hypothetical protein
MGVNAGSKCNGLFATVRFILVDHRLCSGSLPVFLDEENKDI